MKVSMIGDLLHTGDCLIEVTVSGRCKCSNKKFYKFDL